MKKELEYDHIGRPIYTPEERVKKMFREARRDRWLSFIGAAVYIFCFGWLLVLLFGD